MASSSHGNNLHPRAHIITHYYTSPLYSWHVSYCLGSTSANLNTSYISVYHCQL